MLHYRSLGRAAVSPSRPYYTPLQLSCRRFSWVRTGCNDVAPLVDRRKNPRWNTEMCRRTRSNGSGDVTTLGFYASHLTDHRPSTAFWYNDRPARQDRCTCLAHSGSQSNSGGVACIGWARCHRL